MARKTVDPDETVTYLAAASVKGARTLCLAAGVGLAGQHVLTGMLATPFFGSEAAFWANVLGSFMLSIALGFAFGDRLGAVLGGAPRGPSRLLALGGTLVVAASWSLPRVARFVLDRDPDSPFAAAETLLPVLVLPGIVLASVVPSSIPGLGAPVEPGKAPATLARDAVRRFALALLGGSSGVAVAAWSLRDAEHAKVWAQVMGLGAALVLLGAWRLGTAGKLTALVLLGALGGLVFGKPSELQAPEFEAALGEEVVLQGAGRYYARTAGEHVLTGTELARRLGVAERRLQGADKKIAVLLVVETLKTMGPLNISGKGLKNLLNTYLPDESKPLILPFVDNIHSVRGNVTEKETKFHFEIERGADGHAHFKIPGKTPDEAQEFAILDDFDLSITTEGDAGRTTRFTIGPQRIEKAGVFEFNDTIKTPLVCKNVALWIDASLLAISIENEPGQVLIKASAQASVGAVQTQLLQAIDKAKVQ